ncbi:MAG: hypothetical protein H0X15_04865 [Acidobacteria bacterium]|nr:hypothetical protein [Acidobacteriota bacterium]MBA4185757.1 hypothetical protein [Acidobacteriota bacterium]
MTDEKVSYRRKDIIKILADLNVMVVSLDRIGSYYSECKSIEEYHALSSNFLDEWKILPKLANARKILDSAFSYELGDDDMDELEREFQDLQYWSMKNPKPLKKGKSR